MAPQDPLAVVLLRRTISQDWVGAIGTIALPAWSASVNEFDPTLVTIEITPADPVLPGGIRSNRLPAVAVTSIAEATYGAAAVASSGHTSAVFALIVNAS